MLRRMVKALLRRCGYDLLHHGAVISPHWPHLKACLSVHKVTAAIDVGAHEGLYALELRSLGFRGPILSVEPVPQNRQVLETKAQRDPLWDVCPYALDETSGQQSMNVTQDTRFSSFNEPLDWCHEWSDDGSRIESQFQVDVRRLDEVVCGDHPIAQSESILLKVDTQGSDLRVLAGAAGLLDRVSVIQLELTNQPLYDKVARLHEAVETLEELGFRLSHLTPTASTDDLVTLEFDTIFVRPLQKRVGKADRALGSRLAASLNTT